MQLSRRQLPAAEALAPLALAGRTNVVMFMTDDHGA
jgi:hypothetical protein